MKTNYSSQNVLIKSIWNLKIVLLFLCLGFSNYGIAQCDLPVNITTTSRTSQGATITWDAPNADPILGYYYYVTSVQQVNMNYDNFTTDTSINITGYASGVQLYVYFVTRCSFTSESSVGLFSFYTLAPGTGCPTAPYGLFPTETFNPTFSSTPDIISTNSYAGHYSKVNILRNRQYVFNSSVSTDYITITNESSGIIAHGPAPLTWDSGLISNNTVIHYYTTSNSFCSTEETGRTKTIKGQLVPGCSLPINVFAHTIQNNSVVLDWDFQPGDKHYYISANSTTPNVNQTPTGLSTAGNIRVTGLLASTTYHFWVRNICNSSTFLVSEWVSGGSFTTQAAAYLGCYTTNLGSDLSQTFVPACFGNQEIISTTCLAGQYNTVSIEKNKKYTFYSSVITDFITVFGPEGYRIASGTTPLVWSSVDNSGDVRFLINRSSNCDTEIVARTMSIRCQDANPSCDTPNAFQMGSITSSEANASWAGATHTPSDGYQYYLSTINTAPTLATVATGSTGITNLSLLNLNANTTYYIWVRSNCGSSTSSWVFGNSFSTVGASPSGCTTSTNGVLPATTFTPGCFGNTETILTNARTRQYTNVTLSANTRYTFSTSVISDYITITNADASQVYTVGTTPLVWDSETNSGTMRYYLHSNFACGFDSDIRTKSISCMPTPNCTPPSGFITSDITENSATLAWTASGANPNNGYQYYISTSNTSPTTATSPTGYSSNITAIINGLNPATVYYVWVRSDCGTSQSNWSSSFNFTTIENVPTGCTTATYGLYPDTIFTPACTGSSEIIVDDTYAGEYSNVIITTNTNYTFSSSVASDFITISNSDGSTVLASGTSPLVWNSGINTGTLRYYIHLNSNCEDQATFRVRSITCANGQNGCNAPTNALTSNITSTSAQLSWSAASPAPSLGYDVYFSTTNSVTPSTVPTGTINDTIGNMTGLIPSTVYYTWIRSNCGNSTVSTWIAVPSFTTLPSSTGCLTATYGLYPNESYIPICTGTAEIIIDDAYASEYSNVVISTNTDYTFSSSVATDFITISNEDGSTVYSSGLTPLVWNSGGNTGVIRYYFHSNSSCAEENINRTKSISCANSQTCNPPLTLAVSNILTTEALLSWSAASPAPGIGYDVYLSTTNIVTAATVPIGTVTTLFGQLNNLVPSTTYYFWVRSNCGTSDVSSWAAGPSFTTTTPTGTGCITATYGLYPEATFTPTCSGLDETIVTDAYAGEYSNVNIVANKQYTFTSSVATDFITISNENATIIYASGVSPLVWNSSTNTGVIRYYTHTNAGCGDQNIDRIKNISCEDEPISCASPSNLTVSNISTLSAQLNWNAASPIPLGGYNVYFSTINSISPTTTPTDTVTGLVYVLEDLLPATTYYFWVRSNCGTSNVSNWIAGPSFTTATPIGTGCITATYGLFPEATFTPTCSGSNETIVINAYAGEYSNVNIVTNKQYTFSSSIATDFITVSNANATEIYASGVSPLVWNSSANTGVIRYYTHTNASCGEQNADRIKNISCEDEPISCASPSNLTVSNISTLSAQLNWDAASPIPIGGYNVYFSTINSISPTTTPTDTVTGLVYVLEDLLPATTYYFWVRSNCGTSNVSSWIAGSSFTTATPIGTGCITATYGLFPETTFTPICNGINDLIVSNAYAGEYSNVNIVANMQYTFTSSVSTDFITISNANATEIYASGVSPLVWNSSANTGVIRYYMHTDSGCGDQSLNRLKYIFCDNTLSIEDHEIELIKLYPNPFDNVINITSDKTIDTIKIYNLIGQLVIQKNTNLNKTGVEVSSLQSGIYFVKVYSGKYSRVFKVIKN